MANFDVSIYLSNGATTKVTWDFSVNPTATIEQELQKEEFNLRSTRDDAVLVIKRPRENVVAFLVDRA